MIIFSDNFNFKKNNFETLYSFLNQYHLNYEYDESFEDVKKNPSLISKQNFNNISSTHVDKNETFKGIYLYDIYEYELLNYCMGLNSWVECLGSKPDQDEIWAFILDECYDELVNIIECSKFWIEYWLNKLSTKDYKVGLFFSGGQVYNRAFCEVLKLKNKPSIALEHFFTGNDFYFEVKYSPIPNNSITMDKRFFNNLSINEQESLSFNSDHKLYAANNKNVKQPAYSSIQFDEYILILMQVRNDYAIASKNNEFKNSVKFIIELINELVSQTNKTIVIKAHPYEDKKLNEDQKSSISFIEEYIGSNLSAEKDRIVIYYNHSLESLIDSASQVVTLNSQGGIEAANRCKPVICFGKAFYGQKGFTYDYSDIKTYINELNDLTFDADNLWAFKKYKRNIFKHLIGEREVFKVKKVFESIGYRFPVQNTDISKSNLLDNEGISNRTKVENMDISRDTVLPGLQNEKINSLGVSNNINKESPINSYSTRSQYPKAVRLVRKLVRDPKQFIIDTRIFKLIKGEV